MFRFSHFSDLHLPLPSDVQLRALLNKRSLGYLSWHAKRSRLHRRAVSDALLDDLQNGAFDHHCVTGDLTNLGLPIEYETAATWLQRLAPPARISLVPGNHELMVRAGSALLARYWQPWLPNGFPYLQRRGSVGQQVAFIGLSTAIATPPFMAYGKLGAIQLHALRDLLDQARREGLIRIVLLHHPPQTGAAKWRKSLHDAAALRAVLAQHGAELILHGHLHHPVQGMLAGPHGAQIPVFGAGSASLDLLASEPGLHNRAGHYHRFTLEERTLHIEHRRWDRQARSFAAAGIEAVSLPI